MLIFKGMNFKIGDKVKCIDNLPHRKFGVTLVLGKIYIIRALYSGSLVEIENSGGIKWYFDRFELSKKRKIG